jgi:hypothetical protein
VSAWIGPPPSVAGLFPEAVRGALKYWARDRSISAIPFVVPTETTSQADRATSKAEPVPGAEEPRLQLIDPE